ncbi:PMT-domain-containing protein [Rhizoclosmatium globosum]|uniref:Dolichyl-phosphate-mannose--protein mannosyltransferase n=1 Tax=Rhizoclosmatium globosum TaxID=329046 RepID=A0A1Y2CU13_9FUNG|nr:PMT-domain-containing protein [Rhizoclosmatium globosum]|eukprot:ORY50482.1 PMT-domain-containing protein [Rhizoclosmatium globosum]
MALTFISLFIRLFRISNPHEVVFDEVHFGGFATKYLSGKFFMDVHPPLGKLLYASAGVLSGSYNRTFTFEKIGTDYLPSHVPYVFMRLFPAVTGALMIPTAYGTLRKLGTSTISSVLVAGMLLLENAFVTQSRLILLDAFLLFFTSLTVYFWADFQSLQEKPFSAVWYRALALTGVSLGLTCSVKWVGLFLIATIGLQTIQNLWTILGDSKRVSPNIFIRHFFARAFCLILLPATLYTIFFQIHFLVLGQHGAGSGFMSPEFQASLKGRSVPDAYLSVGYGSTITLRHHATSGGYLHSHPHNYPAGSKQQQITCYGFADANSNFLVEKAGGVSFNPKEFEGLRDGQIIRLKHIATNKHLHSHDKPPPLSNKDYHFEVSGYGISLDTNDHWRVEVVPKKKKGWGSGGMVRAMHDEIKLMHVNRRCYLFSHKKKLPEWGFSQQEVTCAKNGNRPGAIWRIEGNTNPLLPTSAVKANYIPLTFWQKFIELHQKMWEVNSGLTKSHPYESRPGDWPFMVRGINFWTHKEKGNGRQIYLIGNPFVWWIATCSVVACMFVVLVGVALVKRRILQFTDLQFVRTWSAAQLLSSAYIFHYIPFFLMHRQLFLHHYLPSLYFSILSIGILFDLVTLRLPRPVKLVLACTIMAITILIFLDYSPLSYGFLMHKRHCERLKWRRDWDWSCINSIDDTHDILPHPGEVLHHDDGKHAMVQVSTILNGTVGKSG